MRRPSRTYRLHHPDGKEISAVNEFLDALCTRGLSTGSLRTYGYSLGSFWSWLAEERLELENLTEADLYRYIRFLKRAKSKEPTVAPVTINLRLIVARSFYRYQTGKELPAGRGSAKIPPRPYQTGPSSASGYLHPSRPRRRQLRLSAPRRVVVPLSREEVGEFLSSLRSWRDLTMAALMLLCGLRSREVINLTLSDLDFAEAQIRVCGKGNKERMVPLPAEAISAIKTYLAGERPKSQANEIFLSLKGKKRGSPMTAAGLRTIFRYHRRRSKVARANPHRFRHTFGADMARGGISLPALMHLMGHTNIHTTMLYVELSPSDVWEEFHRVTRKTLEERGRLAGLNFIRYLEAHHPEIRRFSSLSRSHIEGWLGHLWKRKLKPDSRRNLIIDVRRFLEDITAWDWKNAPQCNLFNTGDAPPEEKRLPRALIPDADQAIQQELNKIDSVYAQSLLLLRYTGLRISELRNLEIDSLKELPNGQWILHVPLGKLHNERVIPVDESTAMIFEKIKGARGQWPPRPHPETREVTHFLLIHRKNQRISARKLRSVLRQAKGNAMLKEEVTPHMLRHSFATSMIRGGMSLPVLKEILGHRSIRMTLRYILVTQVDIQREYHSALNALKNRYRLPKPKAIGRPEKLTPTAPNILDLLKTIASLMESFRRDMKQNVRKKKIQRLVERLTRLYRDFKDLAS